MTRSTASQQKRHARGQGTCSDTRLCQVAFPLFDQHWWASSLFPPPWLWDDPSFCDQPSTWDLVLAAKVGNFLEERASSTMVLRLTLASHGPHLFPRPAFR